MMIHKVCTTNIFTEELIYTFLDTDNCGQVMHLLQQEL